MGSGLGHWSAWQAARVEVNQQLEAKRREEEDLAGDVVARMVGETDVQIAQLYPAALEVPAQPLH